MAPRLKVVTQLCDSEAGPALPPLGAARHRTLQRFRNAN